MTRRNVSLSLTRARANDAAVVVDVAVVDVTQPFPEHVNETLRKNHWSENGADDQKLGHRRNTFCCRAF